MIVNRNNRTFLLDITPEKFALIESQHPDWTHGVAHLSDTEVANHLRDLMHGPKSVQSVWETEPSYGSLLNLSGKMFMDVK